MCRGMQALFVLRYDVGISTVARVLRGLPNYS
nr:MAG TPA: LacI family transcription regulator [Caudoviricetes sp.]